MADAANVLDGRFISAARLKTARSITVVAELAKSFDHAGFRKSLRLPLPIVQAVKSDRIGERHASACRYKNEVPEGLRRSAHRSHFWPREVY